MTRLKYRTTRYLGAATQPDQYPRLLLPEIAIIGRSNVGKSSLINHLFRNKGLAKVSSTPGKTRLLHFFAVDEKIVFVDLPGYGFAKNPDESWERWVSTYLTERTNLKLVLLLIDSRHPISALDQEMLSWLSTLRFSFIVILTKCDKVRPAEIQQRSRELHEIFGEEPFKLVNYSIHQGEGRQQLLQLVEQLL